MLDSSIIGPNTSTGKPSAHAHTCRKRAVRPARGFLFDALCCCRLCFEGLLIAVILNYEYGANTQKAPTLRPGQDPNADCDSKLWHCDAPVWHCFTFLACKLFIIIHVAAVCSRGMRANLHGTWFTSIHCDSDTCQSRCSNAARE